MFKCFQESRTIKWINNKRDNVDFSPPYQRRGNLWKLSQKQLLIDSILNGLDIPKLYFYFLPSNEYSYAIIDGKQRIETIIDFIEGKFSLSDDFKFINKELEIQFENVAGMSFSELEIKHPALLARFWQYEFSIVFIDTETIDTIDEMFIRINSGTQVNAAEKRNAKGGLLAQTIGKKCEESIFFTQKIAFNNQRFQHNDLLLKLLMIEMDEWDLTKKSMDRFIENKKMFDVRCKNALNIVMGKLETIAIAFDNKDKVLKRKNIIVSLYTIIDEVDIANVKKFLKCFETLRMNVAKGEEGTENHLDLMDFNNLLQQGADKKSSIQIRQEIMRKYWHYFRTQDLI